MKRRWKVTAAALTAVLCMTQTVVFADVLPEYESADFTWQEEAEGTDEFPVDQQGYAVVEENGCYVRVTGRTFLSESGTVQTYSVKKDGDTYLSDNFQVKEFACRDGSDEVLIDDKLVDILQQIRDHFGAPLTITSGYRTSEHNAKVGGASRSYHLYGMAADIKVKGHTPSEVAAYAESIGVKGIGLYSSWVHVDTRVSKYYWNSVSSATYEESSFQRKQEKGDVDGDGIATSTDSLLVLKYAVGIVHLDSEQVQAGDVNDDGFVDALDALLILKSAVHL